VRSHTKASIAAILAVMLFGASAAFALQTHKPSADVEAPPDGFGSLAGLAADSTSHQLYAADAGANRIERFSFSGEFEQAWGLGVVASGPDNVPVNEHQRVVISVGVTGGTFTLSYEGEATTPTPYNASAAEVQAALEALAPIGAGNVSVTEIASGPYDVEFTGALADTDVSEMGVDPSGLEGEQVAIVSTKREGGAAYEICEPANGDTCKPGFAANEVGQFNGPQDVVVDPSGNVFVADTNNNRIEAFQSTGAPLASFGTGGSINGIEDSPGDPDTLPAPFISLSNPCGLAVDQTNDNLFVADQGNNRIWIFDSSGAFLGKVADSSLQGPCGLAFDSAGNLYVRNANDGKVVRFDKAGATTYDFASVLYAPGDSGTPEDPSDDVPSATDVAVDTANDHVYVDAGTRIVEVETSGSQVSVFGQEVLNGSSGIAVDSSASKLYVSDGGAIRTFGALVTLPDAITGEASSITDATATIAGTIDSAGGPDAECSFEWGTDTSYGNTAACDPPGPFSSFESVSAGLSGLNPATTYHFRIVGSNSDGSNPGEDATFTTQGPPLIGKVFTSKVDTSSATLNAKVNPGGTETSYRFEYVAEESFEASGFVEAAKVPVPNGTIPAGNSDVTVSRTIAGLIPNTAYRFRVVATNTVDEVIGDPKTFKTFASPSEAQPGSSPGQGFLPDNRAWEMVSPPDKNGGDVLVDASQVRAAKDGGAAAFASLSSFGDVGGNALVSDYASVRSALTWKSHGLTPPLQPLRLNDNSFIRKPGYQLFSKDLSKAVFLAKSPLTDAANVSLVRNLYMRDDILTPGAGSYHLLTDATTPQPVAQTNGALNRVMPYTAGASDDFDHVIFESSRNLTDNTVTPPLNPSVPKLYEWVDGEVRLVGILPDAEGGGPAPSSQAGQGALARLRVDHVISADGSRISFTVPDTGGQCPTVSSVIAAACGDLYLRDDQGTPATGDDTTVHVNASEKGVPDAPQPATYWDATPDGSQIFFTSSEQLTDVPGGGLYRYDASEPDSSSENLMLLAGFANGVIGTSEDGSYVYFTAEDGGSGGAHIYLWHEGELRQVAGVNRGLELSLIEASKSWDSSSTPNGRTSPDGTHLAFMSQGTDELTGYEQDNPNCGGYAFAGPPCTEVYVYDAIAHGGAGRLACASCNPTGASATRDATTVPLYAQGVSQLTSYRNRPISDDGRFVFFTTAERLVPEDTNGVEDAYEYDTLSKDHHLLSSGEDSSPSFFLDASGDGTDVFIATREQLSGWDTDQGMDLYDARIDGGLPEPPPLPPSCQGDACQPSPLAPNDATPATHSTGPGNQSQRCRHHKDQRCRHHKKRRVHKKHPQRHKARHARVKQATDHQTRPNQRGRAKR
jgi:hypothetical protein